MKTFYRILLMTLLPFLTTPSKAQWISNGDFETWIPSAIFTLDPEDWMTYNTEVNPAVTPDSMAYQGELAMKVTAVETGLGAYGEALQTNDISYIPEALQFYAKWDKTSSAGIGVSVTFYNEESIVAYQAWSPATNQSEWTPITLLLNQIEPIITHATIRVSASVGDLVAGTAWISVDEMQLGTVEGVAELHPETVQIGPNPCDQYLNVQFDDQRSLPLSVIDMYGNIVIQANSNSPIDVSLLSNGQYILQSLENGTFLEKKFIVQH